MSDDTHPHTIRERNLLGAALTFTTLLDHVTVDSADLADPRHAALWDLMADMRTKGRTIDPATVLASLHLIPAELRQGIDGLYLHGLHRAAPTTRNEGEMAARDVAENAANRRLHAAGVRIVQLAEAGGPSLDNQEAARAEVDAAVRHAGDDVVFVGDTIAGFLDEADNPSPAVPTGWPDLDYFVRGWKPGNLCVVGARPSVGKALALDTPIPTPAGWSTMGEVRVGDLVFGADGRPTRVVAATEVMNARPCYAVEFSDGETIIADAQHQWLTETRASRRAATPPGGYTFKRSSPFSRDQRHVTERSSVKTTEAIAASVRVGSDHRANHSIPVASPLDLPVANLPVDPYLLGYWLGDGHSVHSVISVSDEDLSPLLDQVAAAGYHHRVHRDGTSAWRVAISTSPIGRGSRDSMAGRLWSLGLKSNKHIPPQYLRASALQRRALLAGLLDSDGTVSAESGRVAFAVTCQALAMDFLELARSLGYQATLRTKPVQGRREATSTCYTIGFLVDGADVPFRLPRKAERVQGRGKKSARRYITEVRPVPSVPVRCIEVAAEDHMYLAGRSMVATHNSILLLQAAVHMARTTGRPVAFHSLEMTRDELTARMVAQDAEVSLSRLEGRTEDPDTRLTERDWRRISERIPAWSDLPLAVDTRPAVTVADIRAYARRVISRKGDLAGIFVDYLQLLTPARGTVARGANRTEVVGSFSRSLKLLAKELNVPVVAAAQLNRGVTDRQDKRPTLADLRESGAIEQDSDVVLLLHTEDDPDNPGDLDALVAKNRQGTKGVAHLSRQGEFARIVGNQWRPRLVPPPAEGDDGRARAAGE